MYSFPLYIISVNFLNWSFFKTVYQFPMKKHTFSKTNLNLFAYKNDKYRVSIFHQSKFNGREPLQLFHMFKKYRAFLNIFLKIWTILSYTCTVLLVSVYYLLSIFIDNLLERCASVAQSSLRIRNRSVEPSGCFSLRYFAKLLFNLLPTNWTT